MVIVSSYSYYTALNKIWIVLIYTNKLKTILVSVKKLIKKQVEIHKKL